MKTQMLETLASEKGMATIETIPLLLIFVFLISYTFGAFGIVHTGILNSIAARNYAFETFRGRSNLTYFRDASDLPNHFKSIGTRIHAIQSEQRANTAGFFATERPLRIGFENDIVGRDNPTLHNRTIHEEIIDGLRNQRHEVNPVWVVTQYGICLNARCGD